MVSGRDAAIVSVAIGTAALVVAALLLRGRKTAGEPAKPSDTQKRVPRTKSRDVETTPTTAPAKPKSEETTSPQKPSNDAKSKADLSQEESTLGTKSFKSGSYGAAIEHFARAIELCPREDLGSRKVLLNNKAAAHERLEQWESVVADCSSALAIDPTYRRALARRAKALEQLNKLEEALDDLALWRNLDLSTLSDEERTQIGEGMDRIARTLAKTQAEIVWRQRSGDSSVPLEIPRPEACKQFYYGMSLDARHMRSPPSSLAIKDVIEHLDPSLKTYVDDLLNIATMYKYRLELKEAHKYWDMVRQAPNASAAAKAQALDEIAGLYHLGGNRAVAREYLENAQRLQNRTQTWIKFAGLAMEDGDFEGAKACLDKALKAIVNGPDAKFDRADVNYHHGAYLCLEGSDLQTARDLLDAAIADVPDFGVAQMQLGVVLFRMNLADEALEALEQARLLLPELAEAWNLNGEVLMSLGRRQEALQCFDEALNVDEVCALPLLNKGVMWLSKDDGSSPTEEDLAKAIELFDKAVEVDPTNEISYIHRASYYCQIGDLDAALKNYDEAIRLVKSMPYLTEYMTFRYLCAADKRSEELLVRLAA